MINKSAITELRELLEKASTICSDNAHLAENIDLISMSYKLDEYIDELNAIENFEVYGDENDNDEGDEDNDDDDSNPLTDHMDFVVY